MAPRKNKATKQPAENLTELQKAADKETKTRKPGSQSNSSKRHNNGRGGGK